MNQRISIENSNIYFYNSKNIWNFQIFLADSKGKFNFTLKTKCLQIFF